MVHIDIYDSVTRRVDQHGGYLIPLVRDDKTKTATPERMSLDVNVPISLSRFTHAWCQLERSLVLPLTSDGIHVS